MQQNKGYESLLNTNKPGNAYKRQDKASTLAVLCFIRSVITSGNWWMLRFSTTVHSFKVLAFRRKSIQKQAGQSEHSRDWVQQRLSTVSAVYNNTVLKMPQAKPGCSAYKHTGQHQKIFAMCPLLDPWWFFIYFFASTSHTHTPIKQSHTSPYVCTPFPNLMTVTGETRREISYLSCGLWWKISQRT